MQDYCYPIQVMSNEIMLPKVTIQINHIFTFLILFDLFALDYKTIMLSLEAGLLITTLLMRVIIVDDNLYLLTYPGGYLYLATLCTSTYLPS